MLGRASSYPTAENDCDLLRVQETHWDKTSPRPKIQGMILIKDIPNETYGSAVFSDT